MKPVQVLFEWVLTSAFLILAVLALRALLGKRMGAGLRYALWAVVLVRLLVPVQLFTTPVTGTSVLRETGVEQFVAPPPVDFAPAPAPAQSFALPEPAELPDGVIINYQPAPTDVTVKEEPLPVLQALGWLWLAGSLAMTAAFIASNLKFARRLGRMRAPLDGADRPLPVYIAEGLPSPCLFGLARPAAYVTPEAADDPVMLRHVLAHEYTHFRHGDHIWNILRSIALAVHWWNPLVWLAVVLSRRDCELACDEGALKRLGDGERVAYGRTLLALLTVKPRPGDLLTCATTMTGGQKSVFDRVTRIARAPKRWLWAAVVAVLAAALACVCAFGAAEPERLDGPGPDSEASHEPVMTASPAPTGPDQGPAAGEDGMDFEFHVAGQNQILRFTNLTQAVTSSREITFSVVRYAILDMDRDGETELVLELEGQGGYIILYRMEDGLYGWHEVLRGLEDLKADGTYGFSAGAGDWGYGTVSAFTASGMEESRFTWCESVWGDREFVEELFFVDGAPATQQEFEAASDAQRAKEDAPWRPWEGYPGYPAEAKDWLDAAGVTWLKAPPKVELMLMAGCRVQVSCRGRETVFTEELEGEKNLYVPSGSIMSYVVDLDGDGRDEIVLPLNWDYNYTGEVTHRLHVFDAETLEEYPRSDLLGEIFSLVSSTGDDQFFYLSAPGMDTVVIPKGVLREPADHIEFAGAPEYEMEDGTLYCVLYCDMGGWQYCGEIRAAVTLSREGLPVTAGFQYRSYLTPNSPMALAAERYRETLLGNAAFTFRGRSWDGDERERTANITEVPNTFFADNTYTKIWSFAVVDLDQNGTNEVLAYVCGVSGDMGGYLVLSQKDGEVYCEVRSARSGGRNRWFWDLKTDGTFLWSNATGQAGGWGTFNLDTGEVEPIMYGEGEYPGDYETFWYNGRSATEAEYWEFSARQEEKPDAVWYDFTPENIRAVFQS